MITEEQSDRLRAMAEPDQQTWDLSERDAGAIRAAIEEIDAQRAMFGRLLDLVVRPFRGKWETCDGPRQVGLYASREEAVAATLAAAQALADREESNEPS